MSVCNPGCRKYEERKLAYERQLDKNVRRQLTYSSSSASASNISIQNADYRSIKSGASEYQSCSEATSDSEEEDSPVTPVPTVPRPKRGDKKIYQDLCDEPTPKCTPKDERNARIMQKLGGLKSGKGLPEGAAAQPHSSGSKNKYTSPVVNEDVSKYFRGYVLAEESDEVDDAEIEFERKQRLMKNPREGQPSKDPSTRKTKSKTTDKTPEPRQRFHEEGKRKKQTIFDKYQLHEGLRCLENLCFGSLECTTKLLEDPFIKQTLLSTVVFFLGIKLCQELDSWYIPF